MDSILKEFNMKCLNKKLNNINKNDKNIVRSVNRKINLN